MKYKIKTIGGKILYEADVDSLRSCCEQALKERADLSSADLSYANLHSANLRYANLRSADLRSADLRSADLSYADLSSADLRYANLHSANLRYANLHSANLRSADLRSADLRSAQGINKYLTTPMYMLLDQADPIRAYKIVSSKNEGIYNGGLVYEIGKRIKVDKWNADEFDSCGSGINLASLDWCLREWQNGYKVLLCEFAKEDIVCIPIGSDGKFRVKACTPTKELDLTEYGAIAKATK